MANNTSQTIAGSHENWKGDNMDIKRNASYLSRKRGLIQVKLLDYPYQYGRAGVDL